MVYSVFLGHLLGLLYNFWVGPTSFPQVPAPRGSNEAEGPNGLKVAKY
jgi:hypothetical protein